MKESDGELAADMFVCLAQNGGTGLEEVVWQVLSKAPSNQYLRLVETMRAASIADWVEASEWGIEQDADEESVKNLMLDLKWGNRLTNQLLQKVVLQRHGVSMALYLNTEQLDPSPVALEFFIHAIPRARHYSPHYQFREKLEPRLPRLLELFLQEKEESVLHGWVGPLTISYVPSIVDALMEHLEVEERHNVRSAIVKQFGAFKVTQAVPLLLKLALNDNWILATNAVTSLGQIGTSEAKTALEAVASADADSFRGTGDAMVDYPKLVIDAAQQQLQALRGITED